MRMCVIIGVAVVAAALIPTTAGATPADGQIDIAGAELAGGGGAINVFGTVRCESAGPLNLDVMLQQTSTGGVGLGSNNSHTCLEPGDQVKWAITATGGPWMVGDKLTITALAVGGANAADTEEHVLRWGR